MCKNSLRKQLDATFLVLKKKKYLLANTITLTHTHQTTLHCTPDSTTSHIKQNYTAHLANTALPENTYITHLAPLH